MLQAEVSEHAVILAEKKKYEGVSQNDCKSST